jgi:hypothetical protein
MDDDLDKPQSRTEKQFTTGILKRRLVFVTMTREVLNRPLCLDVTTVTGRTGS